MKETVVGRGCGKFIIAGEHWVLDKLPAVATGVREFVTEARWRPGDSPLSLVTSDALTEAERRRSQAMLDRACAALNLSLTGEVQITSTVPLHRGFGSSAAFAVAVCDLLLQLSAGDPPPDVHLQTLATSLEELVHGRSSGLDPAAAIARGPVFYDATNGPTPIEVGLSGELKRARWVVCDVGASPPTSVAVERSTAAKERMDAASRRWHMQTAARAAEQVRDGLTRGQPALIARGMDDAAAALKGLDVADERMRTATQIASAAGAISSKQSGAGLGGLVLNLAESPESASRIHDALYSQGFGAWTLEISP